MLQNNASIYNYENAAKLIGVVAAIGAVSAAAYNINKYRKNATENERKYIAQTAAVSAGETSRVNNPFPQKAAAAHAFNRSRNIRRATNSATNQ